MDDDVRVLMIEDDETTVEMYRARLSAEGYSVTTARDGEEGLRLAAQNPPDLIYLDLSLPGMDGFEVLQRLRADVRTNATPVVILSNHAEPELRERGLRLGALEFLVKADTSPARLAAEAERFQDAQTPAAR